MPVSQTIDTAKSFEYIAPKIMVDINGKYVPELICLSCESRSGVTPAQAILQYSASMNMTSPNTLGATAGKYKFGARVRVYSKNTTFFLGTLQSRNDQGEPDVVLWTALDDRIFLEKLFVRGCLVADDNSSKKYKFISRYEAKFNPGGLWNCTGVNTGSGIYPVFTRDSYLGKNYESPDETFSEALEVNKITAWTPRRILLYLQLLSEISTDSGDCVDGANHDYITTLYGTEYIDFNINNINGMIGVEIGSNEFTLNQIIAGLGHVDPLDRKSPEINLRGMSVLGAIKKTLDVAGSHELKIDIIEHASTDVSLINKYTSEVNFYGIGFTDENYTNLRIERSGTVTDANTIYDFTLSEDARRVAESVVVEGDIIKLETGLVYLPEVATSTQSLIPAWSDDEENAFLYIINGSKTETEPGEFAKYPNWIDVSSINDFANWVEASTTPFAYSRSAEAVKLARQLFPRVYRAFKIVTENLTTKLNGYDSVFSDQKKYPQLTGARPAYKKQLQYITRSLIASEFSLDWLKTNYDVRVRVRGVTGSSGSYYDVPNASITCTGDGLIWINGIAEEADGELFCIYSPTIMGNKFVEKKSIKINVAMPLDHRVTGFSKIKNDSIFDENLYRGIYRGNTTKYIDSGSMYSEKHQVGSSPSPLLKYFDGTDGTEKSGDGAGQLWRLLPPGSEQKHAQYAAERTLARVKNTRKTSSWKMIGLRREFLAGLWIRNIIAVAGTNAAPFRINAPIAVVTYDFVNSVTNIGGLINEVG